MTSGDNAVDTSRLELLLREHFARTDKKISELKSEIVVMKNDIERMKRDVGFMHDWDLWLIMTLITLLVMPQIAAVINSLFGAIAEGISLIVKAFRKGGKP